ncbi:elongation factor Tu [Acetobacter orientalis]|uniref:Elongation factor Tu, partial n=1 Tax=Acetobacter orientalis TaxID=146474 RepID=A0A2Z5ZM02_9PROT|nr:elongation factor Tu [Acetobacter orientalis]
MSIVTVCGFIFHVSRRNGDTTSAFFRSSIDLVVCFEFCATSFRQRFGDSSRQRRFAMVNVTNGANITVRFIPLKLSLSHFSTPYPPPNVRSSFQISPPSPQMEQVTHPNDYQR